MMSVECLKKVNERSILFKTIVEKRNSVVGVLRHSNWFTELINVVGKAYAGIYV